MFNVEESLILYFQTSNPLLMYGLYSFYISTVE